MNGQIVTHQKQNNERLEDSVKGCGGHRGSETKRCGLLEKAVVTLELEEGRTRWGKSWLVRRGGMFIEMLCNPIRRTVQ